jgi:hypothetical protein
MILGDGTEVRMGNTYGQGEVGDKKGSKEMDRCPLTQTIGSSVMNCRDVDQFEVEEEDAGYPSVDSCVGLDVWVV